MREKERRREREKERERVREKGERRENDILAGLAGSKRSGEHLFYDSFFRSFFPLFVNHITGK